MKRRITLTISPEVSQRAKMLARNRNTSVSHLIETLIDQAASSDAVAGHESLVQRWRGKLTFFLQDMIRYVDIAAVATTDFAGVLSFQMADLEDAMQAAAALSFGAGFIVTRNVKDYSRSPVKAISPAEFARRNVT